MLRGSLRNRRRYFDDEDANPMEGAINIVDAMLVFACGLMLSLVIFWNVDLQDKALVPVEKGAEVSEVNNVTEEVKETIDSEAEYEKLGTVYMDPATGKMYLIQEESASGDSSAGNQASGSQTGN
jgi:hypothetical protein